MACGGCLLRRLLVVTALLPTLSAAPIQEFLQKTAQGTQDSLQRTAQGTQDSLQRTAQGTQDSLQRTAQGTQGSLQRTPQGTQDFFQRTAQRTQDFLQKTAQGEQDFLQRAAMQEDTSKAVPAINSALHREVEEPTTLNWFLPNTAAKVNDYDNTASGPDDLAEQSRNLFLKDTSLSEVDVGPALKQFVPDTQNSTRQPDVSQNSISQPDVSQRLTNSISQPDVPQRVTNSISQPDVSQRPTNLIRQPDESQRLTNSISRPDVSQLPTNSISLPDVSQRSTISTSTLENPKRLTNLFIQPNVPPGLKYSISQPDESQRQTNIREVRDNFPIKLFVQPPVQNVEHFSEERQGEPKNEYDKDLLNRTLKTSVPDMQLNINYSEGRNTIKNALHLSTININQSTVNNYYAKENTKSESEVSIKLSPQVDEHSKDILPRIVGSSSSAGGFSSSQPVGIAIQPVKPRETFPPSPHVIHPPSPQIVTSSRPVNQREIHPPAPVEFPASPQTMTISKPVNPREFPPLVPAEYPASPSVDSFPQAVPQKQIIQVYTTPSPFFAGFTQPPPSQVPKFQPSMSQQHQGSNLPSEQQILYNEPQSPSHPQKQFARNEPYSPQGHAVTSGYSKLTSTPNPANEPPKTAQNQFSGYAKVSEKYDSSGNMFPKTEYQQQDLLYKPPPHYSPEANNHVRPDLYDPLLGYVKTNENNDSSKYMPSKTEYHPPHPFGEPQPQYSPETEYSVGPYPSKETHNQLRGHVMPNEYSSKYLPSKSGYQLPNLQPQYSHEKKYPVTPDPHNSLSRYVIPNEIDDSSKYLPSLSGYQQPNLQPQYSHEKNYPVTPDPYNPLSGYVIPNESDDSLKYLPPKSGYQLPNPQPHNSPEANYPAETYTPQSLKYLSEETPKYGNEPYTKHYNSLTPADAPKESFGNINGHYVIASNPLYPKLINSPNPEHSGHGGKYTPQNEAPQYLRTASGQTVLSLNPYSHQYELVRLETQANSYQKVEHQRNPYQETEMKRHYYRLSSHSKNPLGKASYIVQQPSEVTFSITDAFHFSPDFLETVYIRGESIKEVTQLNEGEDYDVAICNPCNRNYNPASHRFTDWQWRTPKCSGVAICSNNTRVSTGPNRCVRGDRDYTTCNPCGRILKRVTFKKKGASISPSLMSYEDIRIRGLTFYDDNANVYQFSDESQSSRSWDTWCGNQLPEGTDDHEMYRYYYTNDYY